MDLNKSGIYKITFSNYRLNQGKTYFQEGLIYPLRQKRSNKKAVSTILESEE